MANLSKTPEKSKRKSLNFTLLSLLKGKLHCAVDDGEEVGGLGKLRAILRAQKAE